MSLASVLNIADNDVGAQSTRLNTMTSNIADAETVSSSVNKTCRAHHPVFFTMFQQAQGGSGSLFADQDSSGTGVQMLGIVEDQSSLIPHYEPNHPAADANGYVCYPNVNVAGEMADMISVSRVFRTDAEMMNTIKQMMQKVLTLGQ